MQPAPTDRRYTADHEWACIDEDSGNIKIGVTAFAVDQLGDITLVEIPEVGTVIKQGDAFGTVESVKSVSELYAPLSGTITAINNRLEDEPEIVNESPYSEGWLIEVGSSSGFERLLRSDDYMKLITETA